MSAAPLWTAAEAARATGSRSAGKWRARGVSIDSRTLEDGDLFVALKGPHADGHAFVAEAFEGGAAAAVVSRAIKGAPRGRLLRVADTMAALESLGAAARARTEARVVAVTGSVGKTGTKEALKLAFAAQGPTHANRANLNNQWGVPLSLARMPAASRYAVFELGMNRPGELEPLSRQVRPHAAIVTTVDAVHLEFFDSVAAIADAKAEVFAGVEPGGAAILNRDNPHYQRLAAAAHRAGVERVVSFGAHREATTRLISLALHPNCCCIAAEIEGEAVTYKVGAPGRHWAMNSLAVLAAVKVVGGDLGRAALALAQASPPTGRGARHTVALEGDSFTLLDDSYNASPVAMRAAFAILQGTPIERGGRRIAVLGDMLELGAAAAELHAALAEDIVAAGIDLVFTAGPNMARLHAALPPQRRGVHKDDSAALAPAVCAAVAPGDAVLVKGSLGSGMAVVVTALMALGEAPPLTAANG